MKKLFTIENFTSAVFYLSILIFIIGFNFTDSPPPSGWYQQFMPDLGGKQIADITFLDSLNGYAVATQTSDSSYILKTTNAGDNWQIIHRQQFAMTQIQFLNINTGYAGGGYLYKTINGGYNWTQLNTPATTVEMMYIINQDTIFFVNSEALTGGVFCTTNGGLNWQQQFSGGNQNPNKIYMYNARIGFMCNNSAASPNIYKTLNGGLNWSINLTGEYFYDIYFTDSLTGWKCMPGYIAGDSCVKKTTNGGINWEKEQLPHGGIINLSQIVKFSIINKDTIWGVGGSVYYIGYGYRGILYRTVNGGTNWLFQIPDTSFRISIFASVNFINKSIGWAYYNTTGIHTILGGDTTFLTGIQQISSKTPYDFKLFQNYPNPFNPKTIIKYQIAKVSHVKLIVCDITGKLLITLVDQKQSEGIYQVDFSGIGYSSGLYFYNIIVNNGKEVHRETKKMILLK